VVGANPGGFPCSPGYFQFGKGGYFIFETTTGGNITLQLDLNNNGLYTDPVDVTLMGTLNEGPDSIFWDGNDGLGVPIPIQDSFLLSYQGIIRFGELHIALTDVENNPGGVTFGWLNAPPAYTDTSLFYYDHSDLFGPTSVSGGGTPGMALPTTIPYTYTSNAGNDKYLDQWFFIEFSIPETQLFINIVAECVCVNATPELSAVSGGGTICTGQDLVLSATNTFPGIGDLAYSWSGPSGYTFSETIGVADTSIANVGTATLANAGSYQVIATTATLCADTITIDVAINLTPSANAIAGGGEYCAGSDVTLTATNTVPGINSINYTWSGPGVPPGMESGTVAGGDPITLTIPGVQEAAEGTYTLVMTSDLGCVSAPISTTITVNPTPVLTAVSGAGSYCFDEDVTLVASNSAPGITTMICTWNGPNIFNVTQTVNGGDPITLNLNNVNNSFEGTYTVVCAVVGCVSNAASFDVVVNTNPEINAISPNGDFCEGTSLTFTAQNVNPGTGPITYTWTGPNPANPLFPFTGTGPEGGPFEVTIPSLTPGDAGTYTLVLETAGGCASVPQSVTIDVLPAPNIIVTGGGDACLGQEVVLTAINSVTGVGTIIYVWTGPNGVVGQGVINANDPASVTLTNVQGVDAGVYTVTLTIDATGCTSSETVTLNVFPGLNIVDETPDSTYCEFSDVVLTATNTVSAGDLTYQWVGPTGTVYGPFTVGSFDPLTAIIANVTPADAGLYTLEVNSTLGCSSNDVQVLVNVNPGIQLVTVTGGGLYCESASVILSGTGEGSADSVIYTWTDPNGTVIGSGTTTPAGPFTAGPIATLAGTYILEVIASNGCSDSGTADISFNPLPDVIILNNDTTLCDNDTLEICGQVISGIGSFDYVWTTPNGDIISGSGNGNVPFCDILLPLATYGSGLYTLVVSANGCTSEPDSLNITLNPNPVISIVSGGGDYCLGETAEICFTNLNPEVPGFFYTIILPNGTQTTGTANTSNEVICIPVTQSGFACMSLESFEGCVSSLACAQFNFQPGVVLEVTANTPVCENETLNLNGTNIAPCSGPATYTWTGPGGFSFTGTAPCGGPFPANVDNPVSGQYCLIVSTTTICSDTACIDVIVNPAPEVVNNVINGGGDYCEGDDVELTAIIFIADGTPITFTWTLNGTAIPGQSGTAPSGSILTLDLGQVDQNDEGQYCLELESIAGCVLDPPVCTQVNVNPTPGILTVTGGGTYCEGVDVSLNGTGTPGLGNVTYMWTGPNGFMFTGGPVPSQGPFPATVNDIGVLGTGVYILTVKLGDCEDSQSVVVEVNPKPIITVLSGNGTFCEGSESTVSFTIDPNGASSVNWDFTSPTFDTSGMVTTVTTFTFNVVVNSTGTFTITAESSDGCEAEPQSIQANVQQIPTPPIFVSPSTVCPGDDMILSTDPQQGTPVSYEWYKDGVLMLATSVPTFEVPDPVTSGSYSVTVIVDGCESSSAPIDVTIPDAPVANDDTFTSNTITSINGNVLTNDVPSGGVTVTVVSGPSGGTVNINDDGSFTYTPGTTLVSPDEFVYEICLVDCPNACDQATVTITYQVACEVPNVLTPNGDGINDILIIDCVTGKPNNRLRVFNRWGDEIHVFEPYLNSEGWDATYDNDKKPVPAGTYFYLFEEDKNSGDDPKAGYIKVLR
ncbi:MAG: gliding motility-associated C-terminal domain-containing protein, partial [Bacteroidetes bacterium]|nr:gliding motility-associated C-terminal domain-containing protein [Bacteroidota bacterium]